MKRVWADRVTLARSPAVTCEGAAVVRTIIVDVEGVEVAISFPDDVATRVGAFLEGR